MPSVVLPPAESAFAFLEEQCFSNTLLRGRSMFPESGGEDIEAVFVIVESNLFTKELGDHM